MRAASRSMRLPGIFGIALIPRDGASRLFRMRAQKTVMSPVPSPRRTARIRVGNGEAAVAHPTKSHPHAPSPVRPVGGVARAGGGGAHVHLPAGGCRRAGDQGRATGRRLRALLRQARRAARSVCSLPKLGAFPSPACGGGTGRGHATRFVRASSPPPPPPPPPPGGGGPRHPGGERPSEGGRRRGGSTA